MKAFLRCLACWALVILLPGLSRAGIPPRDSLRISIPLADPLTHWDALGTSYVTLQQGIGGMDRAVISHFGDPGAGYRLGEMILVAWPNLALGYYAHELGHDINSDWWGEGYKRKLKWKQWFPQPWPLYERELPFNRTYQDLLDSLGNLKDWRALDEWQMMYHWHGVHGIDQEEWDALLLYRQGNEVLSWDEALAFSFRKLSALTYELYSGSAWGTQFADGVLDVPGYVDDLRSSHMDADRWDWYGPALLSSALSFRLWESLWMDLRFLAGGPRTLEPWRFRHDGWSVIPPLVVLAYTPWGPWQELYLPVKSPSGWESEWSLGRDADWMTVGTLRTWRAGGSLWTPWLSLRSDVRARASVGGAYTLRHSPLAYAGYLGRIGAEVRWSRWLYALELRRSEGDLVENFIHARPQGWSWFGSLGWMW